MRTKRDHDFNKSKFNTFVEQVAENSGENNGDCEKIRKMFQINLHDGIQFQLQPI